MVRSGAPLARPHCAWHAHGRQLSRRCRTNCLLFTRAIWSSVGRPFLSADKDVWPVFSKNGLRLVTKRAKQFRWYMASSATRSQQVFSLPCTWSVQSSALPAQQFKIDALISRVLTTLTNYALDDGHHFQQSYRIKQSCFQSKVSTFDRRCLTAGSSLLAVFPRWYCSYRLLLVNSLRQLPECSLTTPGLLFRYWLSSTYLRKSEKWSLSLLVLLVDQSCYSHDT